MTDGQGLPLALALHAASRREHLQAEAVVDAVRVPQPRGRPRQRTQRLTADKGFSSAAFRRFLHRRRIQPLLPYYPRGRKRSTGTGRPRPKQRPWQIDPLLYKQRWRVERTFAWMDNFRRLVVRYDRTAAHYRAFCILAAILLCLSRLLK